jgi:hypothetical protein
MELDLAPVLTSRLRCCWLSGYVLGFHPMCQMRGVVWVMKPVKIVGDQFPGVGWCTSLDVSIEVS